MLGAVVYIKFCNGKIISYDSYYVNCVVLARGKWPW